VVALFLLRLWQPERQITRHTENLFRSIEHGNWEHTGAFISDDYHDQWGHDRVQMLERVRAIFRSLRGVKINHPPAAVRIYDSRATWIGKVTIEAEENEFAGLIKDRVNSVTTPFELEWRHVSSKPWDWKLVRVANSGLEIPAGDY
jgi:hypothetical protein